MLARDPLGENKLIAYLHEKNNTNQLTTGRNGNQNCLVIGMSIASIKRLATPVLMSGPGNSMMDKQKMPKIMMNTY
jgi:hypothetical protein